MSSVLCVPTASFDTVVVKAPDSGTAKCVRSVSPSAHCSKKNNRFGSSQWVTVRYATRLGAGATNVFEAGAKNLGERFV